MTAWEVPQGFWKQHELPEGLFGGFDEHSQRVDLGDGLFMWTDTRVKWHGGTHEVEIQVVPVEGRLSAGEVSVRRHQGGAGPAVTSEALRRIPVADLVSRAGYLVQADGVQLETPLGISRQAWPSKEEGDYIARHGLDDTTSAIVARIYRVAYLIGKPPTKTVETVLDLPRSTAGRWVAEARRRGFLGASQGSGKAGEIAGGVTDD